MKESTRRRYSARLAKLMKQASVMEWNLVHFPQGNAQNSWKKEVDSLNRRLSK